NRQQLALAQCPANWGKIEPDGDHLAQIRLAHIASPTSMFINRAGRIDQPGIYRSGCIRHDLRHSSAAHGARTHLSSLQRLNSGIGIPSTLAELLQKSVI